MGIAEKKPAADKAIALFEDVLPSQVYGTDGGAGLDAIISRIEARARSEIFDPTTKAGREAASSLAYKVARSKTVLDDMGKDLVADWKARAGKVDAERKIIRDTLDNLRDEIRKPVDAWQKAEDDRIAGHLNDITEIEDLVRFDCEPTSTEIKQRLSILPNCHKADWQEFASQAQAAHDNTLERLNAMLAGAIKREADQAELVQLRAAAAERERKDRDEAAAKEKAERDAERLAYAAQRAEDIRLATIADDERKAAAAVEAERRRVADEQAAAELAASVREQNKRHRNKVIKAAHEALVEAGLTSEQAMIAIDAIAANEVPNVMIRF